MPEQPSIPTAISEPTHVIRPTTSQERIQVIDILRGFALFGILLANMGGFSGPESADWWTATPDLLAKQLIFFLGQAKFLTIFSFLFGLGFALPLLRAEARGAPFFPLYRRRLLALLLIGLLHALFLSHMDVLTRYAVVGFLLFFFTRAKPKTLMIFAVILLLFHYGNWELTVFRAVGRAPLEQESQTSQSAAENREAARIRRVEADMRAYGEGSFADIMAHRVQAVFNRQVTFIGGYPVAVLLGLFLLGMYAGRRRLFQDVSAHLPLFRQVWRWGLGLALLAACGVLLAGTNAVPPYWRSLWTPIYFAIGVPALSFFYISTLVLLFQKEAWKRRLAPLAAVGRMALSNYLLQSVVCTTIFYSYGLGLYGKVSPALGMALTVLIFTLQIMLSVWWLKHFRFGPAEWLWRTLTYGKLQPMRLRRA